MTLQPDVNYRSHTEPTTIPYDHPQQPKTTTTTKTKVVRLTLKEALVYITLAVMIAMSLILVLSLKSESFEMQAEKTMIENTIYVKQGEISELKTEATALSSYDRIYEKAYELGLTLNNRNIRVVEKK